MSVPSKTMVSFSVSRHTIGGIPGWDFPSLSLSCAERPEHKITSAVGSRYGVFTDILIPSSDYPKYVRIDDRHDG